MCHRGRPQGSLLVQEIINMAITVTAIMLQCLEKESQSVAVYPGLPTTMKRISCRPPQLALDVGCASFHN